MDPLQQLKTFGPTKKAFSLVEEFKAFAFKGNVIDLAVGVIIGTAFAKLIDSLVKNIVMPLISLVLPSDQSYKNWSFGVGDKQIPYGEFIADVVNFLLVAIVLFLFVAKFVGWLMQLRKQEAAAVPPLTKDQELLTEIRDLLKKNPAAAP
jgi:large conductance mechanosensitive channel